MDSITPEIISNKCSKTVRKGLESSLGCPTLSEKNGLSVKEEATVGNTVVAQTPFEESDGLITFPISGPLGVKRQSSHREPRLPSRREMSAWKREEFITQDLAIARNGQVAAKHGGHAYIRLKGWTRVGEFHWNFPIYGSFFDFCELIRALENWDPVERRALLKDNLISARLFNRFRRLFCPPAAGSWKQLAFGAVVAAFEPPEVLEAVDDVVQTHLYIPVAEFGEDDWEEQVFWGMEADLIKLFHYLDVSIHEFVTRWRLYRRLHRFVRTRVALPPYDPRIRINQFYVTQELQEFFDKRYARQVMWKDSMSRAFDDIIERAPVSLINWIKVKFITQPAIRAQGALAAGFNWPVCIAVVLGNVSVWSCDNDVTFFYKCLFVVLLFTASQTVVCRYLQSLHFSYMLYYICLVAPLLEECVKLYVPGLMFACNEVVVKVTSIPLALEKPWAMVPAFLMHCLAGKVSFTTGLFVHVVLNVSVSIIAMSFTPGHDMWFLRHDLARRWFRLSSGTVDFSEACAKFEDLAWVIDLIRKMMAGEKEKVGIMLSLAMRASYLARLKELFEVDSTDDIVDKFSWLQEELTFEQEPGPEEIVLLGTPVKEFFETIVPEYVSHSPAVRKLVALGALIFSSSFVQESSFIKFFQYFVEWDTIKEYSDPLAIVFHGVNAIVKFLMKFPEAKCWEDVFELPGLEKFLREGNELLETEGTPGSQNELLERIAIARILIKKQELKPKMPETSRLVEKLRKFVKDLKTQLDSTRPRKQPMLIDLRGDSGAGKTIIASTIIRMLRAYNKWVEQEGDVLYYNINDKYPASGCRNKYAKFVVINDMPEIYDDFPQRDLMSLDIVWQIILDTYPLTFRFAAVDDKGMFFNDVQYLLCSSNFKAYKCPGRTEKLNRRMDSGVLSMVRLVDAKGNSIPFSSTLKMDQGERNAALKFTICEPACTDKVIALKETEVKYNLQQFLRYVIRRAGEHAARSDDDHKKFEDPASLCACGSSYHLHYHQPAGEKSRFFPILPECVEWILKHPQLAYPSSEPIGGKYEPIFADPVIPSSFWEENSALLLGSPLEYLWHVWFAGVVIFLYHFIQNIFADIWEALAEKYVTSFELWAVSHPLVYKAFQLKARLRDDEVYLRTCMYLRRNMLKLKLYAIKYRNFLMLASLAAIAGLVTVRKRKVRSEALGGAIFKEQVDPNSMFVEVSRREMAYTPQAAKAWNKPGAEIYHVELTKKGTSQFDLLAKLRAQVVRARQVAPEGPRNIWVLILNSNHVVMNGHYLYPKFDGNSKPFEKFSLEIFGKFQAYELSEVVRVPGKEYVLLHNSFMPHAYPLSDNMPVDSVSCLIDGTLVNGEKSIDVVAGPGAYYDASLDTTFTQVLQWDCVNTVEEEAGNCGSTLMIRVKEGWAIGAFMSFGVRKHEKGPLKLAGGCTFDKRTYDYAVSSEPTVHYHLCGIPLVENLSIRSDFREVGSPHLLTVGTVSGGTNTFRSTIKQSRVFANFAPYARESFSVPLKVRGLVGGEWKSAMKHTFKNVNLPDASSLDLKERAMLGYLEDVRSIAEKIKLRPLLLMEAIFGCPELGIESRFSDGNGP